MTAHIRALWCKIRPTDPSKKASRQASKAQIGSCAALALCCLASLDASVLLSWMDGRADELGFRAHHGFPLDCLGFSVLTYATYSGMLNLRLHPA